MLVSHRLPSARWWIGNDVSLLSIPRAMLYGAAGAEAGCGMGDPQRTPCCGCCDLISGTAWAEAARDVGLWTAHEANLGRLAAGLLVPSAARPALAPARVAAMREVIVPPRRGT